MQLLSLVKIILLKKRTTLSNVAVLPPDAGIGCVTPGLGLFTAGIAAKVLGALHFGEDVERRSIVRVRLLSVPTLTRKAIFGHADIALVETTTSFHARSFRVYVKHKVMVNNDV